MSWKFHLRFFRRRLVRMLLLLSIAFSGSTAPPQRPYGISWSSTLAGVTSAMYGDPCEVAAELRGKVAGVLAEGRLDRTIRLIQKANRLCDTSNHVTWSQEVSTLAELGRYAEARALAKTIDAEPNAGLGAKNAAREALALCARLDKEFPDTDEAKAEMRRLSEEATKLQDKPDEGTQRWVKETFLAAWEAWHPNAHALVSAGLAAKKLGQHSDAQRLFDRALVDAEKEFGHTVTLELPGSLRGMAEVMTWSMDGRLLALYDGQAISIFDRTWRERLRIQAPTFGIHDTFSVSQPTVGHWGPEPKRALDVKKLAISPDGKTLASGDHHNNGIILWDVASGKELRTITIRAQAIYSIVYSPDGKTLATGLSNGSTCLWDVASGKQLHVLAGHTEPVNSIAYSPDGTTLASASSDKSLRVWDATSGRQLQMLEHTSVLTSVVYSPDGKTLAAGSYGHTDHAADGKAMSLHDTVHLWNVATGEQLGALNVGGAVYSLAYSRDGKTLVALGFQDVHLRDKRTWDVVRGKEGKGLVAYEYFANARHYAPDGEVVVAGAFGEPASVRDAATGKVLQVLGEQSNSIRTLTYSPDGKTLASGMEDTTVRVWDAHRGELLHTLAGHTRTVQSVAYSRQSDKLVSGSSDKTVRLWDVVSGKELRQFTGHTREVYSVAFSPNGLTLASSSDDTTVRLWDVATGNKRQTLGEQLGQIYAMDYSPNGKMLAAASDDGLVYVWNMATREPLTALHVRNEEGVSATALLPDGTTLATCNSSAIRLWDVSTGEEGSVFGHWLGCPVLSPDGKTMAGDGEDNFHVIVRDIHSRELMRIKTEDCQFRGVGFSPDGGTYACGARDGSILLFDLYDGVLGATLRDAGIPGASYVFTPSGHIDIQGPHACAARDKLDCRVGAVFFPFDVCEERFFVADLLTHQQLGGTYLAEPEWVTPQMHCAGPSGP